MSPQASPERVLGDFEGRGAAVVTAMLVLLLHHGYIDRRRRVLISTFDPLTIWFLWLAGFTLTIWGMKPGGHRPHTLLTILGNAWLLGLAVWRPEVRLSVIVLLIISALHFGHFHPMRKLFEFLGRIRHTHTS